MARNAEAVFVDTSAWFALVARQDRDHSVARIFLETNKQPLILTDYILDETVTLIQARLNHEYAVRFLDGLVASPRVRLIYLSEPDVQETMRFFKERGDKQWSFTDCSSFVIMQRLGLSVALSFDHHFRQAGFLLAQEQG